MKHTKLTQIASRQQSNSARDLAFGALMVVVVAVMLLAFTSLGAINPASAAESPPHTLADTAAEIEAHTELVCGDTRPAIEPAC